MIIEIDGTPVHIATGGADNTATGGADNTATGGADNTATDNTAGTPAGRPTMVLVHGAGMDATAWQLQTRYLAHHGVRALAIDLPGHGRSGGEPLTSIEAMADWLARFIEAIAPDGAAAEACHVAGHSMGTFIGLELARRRPELVRSLVLLGTADAMGVHPDLLAAAEHDLPAAAALMASWGHAAPAHTGLHPNPGLWMLGGSRALVELSRPGALAADFTACAAWTGAATAAAATRCPVTVVVGRGDKMTPAKAAGRLIDHLDAPRVIELDGVGHMHMTEAAAQVRTILATAAVA